MDGLQDVYRSDVCLPEIVFDNFYGWRAVKCVRGRMMDRKKKVLFSLILLKAVDD